MRGRDRPRENQLNVSVGMKKMVVSYFVSAFTSAVLCALCGYLFCGSFTAEAQRYAENTVKLRHHQEDLALDTGVA